MGCTASDLDKSTQKGTIVEDDVGTTVDGPVDGGGRYWCRCHGGNAGPETEDTNVDNLVTLSASTKKTLSDLAGEEAAAEDKRGSMALGRAISLAADGDRRVVMSKAATAEVGKIGEEMPVHAGGSVRLRISITDFLRPLVAGEEGANAAGANVVTEPEITETVEPHVEPTADDSPTVTVTGVGGATQTHDNHDEDAASPKSEDAFAIIGIKSALKTSRALMLNIENPGLVTDFYTFDKKTLGKGAFGSVSKARVRATKADRAIKSIKKALMKDRLGVLKKEIEIMKMVDHPNIIKLYEIFEDATTLYLVMELCLGGTLDDKLTRDGGMSERQTAAVMHQTLRAVAYLHKTSICHRDLKADNLLFVQATDPANALLKVMDFGLSTTFKPGRFFSKACGTPAYMAPQVIDKRYDHSCDSWSCGVIMYESLCGYRPFTGKDDEEVKAMVKKGNFAFASVEWVDVSQGAMDMVCSLMQKDVSKRLTPEVALQNEWLVERLPKQANVPIRPVILDNLRGFRKMNKFMRAALQISASLLTESQLKLPRESFLAFDFDGDGHISLQEMKESIEGKDGRKKSIHVKQGDVEEMFSIATNQSTPDAMLDFTYTEFLAATFDRQKYLDEDVCRAVFFSFDKDGDGHISRSELLNGRLLGNLSQEDITQLVQDLDQDGDEVISFAEFMEMVQRNTEDWARCYHVQRTRGHGR